MHEGDFMRKIPKTVTADEAVSVVKSGDLIYLSGFANTPETLLNALCRRAGVSPPQLLRG